MSTQAEEHDVALDRRQERQKWADRRIARDGIKGFRVIRSAEAAPVTLGGISVDQLPRPDGQ